MFGRVRRRYLALNVRSDQPLSEKDLIGAIWHSLLRLFGEYGASQADLRLIKYNPQNGYAILRCSHKTVDMVRASIAAITSVQEMSLAIHVVRVSGTLKALRRKMVTHVQ